MTEDGDAGRFEGFTLKDLPTPRGTVRARVGGAGPPLLVLHGYPQTHLMWHPVAAALAERFTVVAADVPGYGGSFRPRVTADHVAHAKRTLATDLVAAMAALGHDAFAVAGHDRGGRVGYRMALDHPAAVLALVAMDIVPTGEVWARADARFATGYWHWSFMAQPPPLPEKMILGDPGGFWIAAERLGITPGDPRYPDDIVAAYRAQLTDPDFVTAMCEDYRAGATIDRELDDADVAAARTIACPVHALWGAEGALPRFYDDPLEPWRALAPHATGARVEGAGHFLVEDQPARTAAELLAFLA
jgi:haloacetate dehalogenase